MQDVSWNLLRSPDPFLLILHESFLSSLLDSCQCFPYLIWNNLSGKDGGELGYLASEGVMLAKKIRNLFGHLMCLFRGCWAVLVVLRCRSRRSKGFGLDRQEFVLDQEELVPR